MLTRLFNHYTILTKTITYPIHKQRTGGKWNKNTQFSQVRRWSKYKVSEFSAYFQDKIDSFDQQTKSIINLLNNEAPRNSQIQVMIQDYLKVRQNANFLTSSPLNKIYLLVALQMRSNFNAQQLQQLRRQIIEHILRHPSQNMVLDAKSLQTLVKSICKFGYKIDQKYKANVIVYLVMNSLCTNFHKINYSFFPFIVSFINTNLQSNTLNSLKYLKFINLLQERTNGILMSILNDQHLNQECRFIYKSDFVKELVEVYSVYGFSSQYASNLYAFLIKKYLPTKLNNPSQAIHLLNLVYRNFPHYQQGKDINYKLCLLQYITSLYKSNSQFNYEIHKESAYLCYSMLTHFLHSYYTNLSFHQEDGFTYLPLSSITKAPQLPHIFWELYQANSVAINSVPIMNYTIKNCYPSKYIESSQQAYNEKPVVDTQMNLRVDQSLSKLKLRFTSQEYIAGRFIDFHLYEKNVLIEVDGVIHYEPQVLRSNDKTNYRNAHLILSGYKLMVISIYEYNICRQIQQLSQLISFKLALLQQKAVLVC